MISHNQIVDCELKPTYLIQVDKDTLSSNLSSNIIISGFALHGTSSVDSILIYNLVNGIVPTLTSRYVFPEEEVYLKYNAAILEDILIEIYATLDTTVTSWININTSLPTNPCNRTCGDTCLVTRNPGGECYRNAPTNIAQIDRAECWGNINNSIATPDLFHEDGTGRGGVPVMDGCSLSSHTPRTGAGFFGLRTWRNDFREYMHQDLCETALCPAESAILDSGKNYIVSYFAQQNFGSNVQMAGLGAMLTNIPLDHRLLDNQAPGSALDGRGRIDPLTVRSNPLYTTVQYINSSPGQIVDETGWDRITGVFQANGEERWLSIGSFEDNATLNSTNLRNPGLNCDPYDGANDAAHYLIDDIILAKIGDAGPNQSLYSNCCIEIGDPCNYQENGFVSYEWFPKTGLSNPFAPFTELCLSDDDIELPRSVTYTLRTTVNISGRNTFFTDQVIIDVSGQNLFINGSDNICDDPIQTYSFNSPFTGFSSSFKFNPLDAGSVLSSSGNNVTVEWDASKFVGGFASLIVTVSSDDPADECEFSASLEVSDCFCFNEEIDYDYMISNDLASEHFNKGQYVSGKKILVNGVLVMDVLRLEFIGNTFYMGPNSEIVSSSDGSMYFHSNSFIPCDSSYMWDGIYFNFDTAPNLQGKDPFVNNTVKSAEDGLVVIGAKTTSKALGFKNNVFIDCFFGMKIFKSDISKVGLSRGFKVIDGNEFKTLYGLIKPYLDQKSYAGVYSESSTITLTDCYFEDLKFGVKGLNSTAEILGCTFINNLSTGNPSDWYSNYEGTAVFWDGNQVNSLLIDELNGKKCYFENNLAGVFIKQRKTSTIPIITAPLHLNIKSSVFKGNKVKGIHLVSLQNGDCVITDNRFEQYTGLGIHFLDKDFSTTFIENNLFKNPSGNNTKEIVVEDFPGGYGFVNVTRIKNNQFENVNNGILIRSLNEAEISGNNFTGLNYHGTGTNNYGIRCENSPFTQVFDNTIQAKAKSNFQTKSIEMVSSPSSNVYCNITDDGGVPFQFIANNSNTRWFNNLMRGENATGLVLSWSTFASQGGDNDPAENIWLGNFNHRYHMFNSDGRDYDYHYGTRPKENPNSPKSTGVAHPFNHLYEILDLTLDSCSQPLPRNGNRVTQNHLGYYRNMHSIRSFQAYNLSQYKKVNTSLVKQDSLTLSVLDSLKGTPGDLIIEYLFGVNQASLQTLPISTTDSIGLEAVELKSHYLDNGFRTCDTLSLNCLLEDGPFAFIYATTQGINAGGKFVKVPSCKFPVYSNNPPKARKLIPDSPIVIYPNPSRGVIRLSGIENNIVDYILYNLQGKQLQNGISHEGEIDFGNFSVGTYILKLEIDEEQYFHKVVLY